MSENNVEPQIQNNEQSTEPKPKRRRTNRQLSDLTKDAESILKGFDAEKTPEGRRTTRSAVRGPATPSSTSAKKEPVVSSSVVKRGRRKREVSEKSNEHDTENVEVKEENDDVDEESDVQDQPKDSIGSENDLGTSNGDISETGDKVEDVEIKENNISNEERTATDNDAPENGGESAVDITIAKNANIEETAN